MGGAAVGAAGISAAGADRGAPKGVKQSTHRDFVLSYQDQVTAVQNDVFRGSGRVISEEEAKKMLYAVQSFSATAFTRIRNTYKNPNADAKDAKLMRSLDDYIHSSPKWEGKIYRGINVTTEEAVDLLSGKPIDMLGPSSWSSKRIKAEKYSDGCKDVRVVFVLKENKSGASITHIGSWNGSEYEVTAPSGVKYYFDRAKKVRKRGSEIIFIYVHE